MILSVFFFARRLTDMGAKNIQHGLAQLFLFLFGVSRQMEEFVGST